MTEYKWKHIEDLPEGFNPPLQDNGILRDAWKSHQAKLAGSESLRDFNARLAREWSIETGIIERLYSIDRGTTQLLIERGIDEALIPYGATDKPAPEVVRILRTHEEALEGLFAFVNSNRELTVSYIKELHQVITRDQEWVDAQDQFGNPVRTKLIRGDWKQHPNNPKQSDGSVHEYCPPEHVQSEMERLVELHHEHERKGVSPEIQAAWLHHRFTQIHPFQDGNGRVARILASLVLIKAGGLPFTVHRDQRNLYLDNLEIEDEGNLLSFARQVTEQQTRAMLRALDISTKIKSNQLKEIIESGVEKLSKRKREFTYSKALTRKVDEMIGIGARHLETVAKDLDRELKKIDPDFTAKTDIWDQIEVIEGGKPWLGRVYSLTIREYQLTRIGVGLRGVEFGRDYMIGANVFILQKQEKDEKFSKSDRIPFDFVEFVSSAQQPIEDMEPAYLDWLSSAITVALAEWQKRIR